ncbi:Beta-lactamase [Sphingobium indicum BiD32]|uniref:beta-lactamase n=1 Tax=Sphingobium indicum BiD32 TaxID=1301087 RepID=N1MKN2_9SPHN|nr:serine hydrolase [Sphingobium indicum]CCW17506.1 Beta-lactamase [Sphingobium indicum BiD32]
MVPLRPIAMFAALGLFLAPLPDADAFGPAKTAVQQTAEARLIAQFQRFASLTDGTVGIVVRDLATGETLSLNGDTLFPMASAYKVAVAGRIFAMVDAGALTLEERLASPAGPVPVATLLDLMLTRSDNGATDLLVARAGGPAAVHHWVAGLGIRGLRVDSNTADLLWRAMGLTPRPGNFNRNVAAAMAADPALRERDARDIPNIAFAQDPRDTATPTAMTDLVAAIRTGKALSGRSTVALLSIMERCRTGKARLPGMLPPGTLVAHKTGSLNGTGNDTGVITLPDGRLFAITVFVMQDHKGQATRDRIMAEAARATYDYFLFAPDRSTV